MSLDRLAERAGEVHLTVLGTCAANESDRIGTGTLALLGPLEPGFWPHVTASPEFQDGGPDPLDRWSRRVIDRLASDIGGRAHYPFGAPVHPFMTWALRTGRAWASPVHLLVHDTAGLMVSFRGAVQLDMELPAAEPRTAPCNSCASQPCRTACPASALTPDGYDLVACHGFLDTDEGEDCMKAGCQVRRACPVSQSYGRIEAQSAFHMENFHPWP